MMYLDLAELPRLFQRRWCWSVERWNLATFRRRDHVGDPATSLESTIRDLVQSEIGSRPTGPIRLLTHLSYFGYCFNPLSIYFCFDPSGDQLHSVVAEVTNTPWAERHCYVLNARPETAEPQPSHHGFHFAKAFHVSPFMDMDIEYHWKMINPGETYTLHTENIRNGDSFFDATLVLKRREITTLNLVWALFRFPLITGQVMANIYWQALRLWLKKIPYVPHPKTCRNNHSLKNTVVLPHDIDHPETNL